MRNISVFLMITGPLVAALSHPVILRLTVVPLQERGYLPKLKWRQKRREVVSSVGPRMSIFVVGVGAFFLGLILFISHV